MEEGDGSGAAWICCLPWIDGVDDGRMRRRRWMSQAVHFGSVAHFGSTVQPGLVPWTIGGGGWGERTHDGET
jgi:hypothetical protein